MVSQEVLQQPLVARNCSSSPVVAVISLGGGSLSLDGKNVLVSPAVIKPPRSSSNLSSVSACSSIETEIMDVSMNESHGSCAEYEVPLKASGDDSNNRRVFVRQNSSFLRVADIMELQEEEGEEDNPAAWDGGDGDHSTASASTTVSMAGYSYAAVDPPPGVSHDPKERWIALDDGVSGKHSPMAPKAIQALYKAGLESAWTNQAMWTMHSGSRQIKSAPWHVATWPSYGRNISIQDLHECTKEEQVIIWTGKFEHGLYGSDLPAVRAAGILPVSPKTLFDLLIDSGRVKEYNKLSNGRTDLLILQDNMQQEGPFGKSVTKVMRSSSNPPVLNRTMEFVSLLHAQELHDQTGFIIVTRAVTTPKDKQKQKQTTSSSVLQSEILLGVNLIRPIDGDPNRCLMINVTQIRSPMIPMIIANRIGTSAAANFIKDLRTALS
jgi:hypothetical protein